MKKCLRKKCQKEFEPNKPKQLFCSAKCRVYFSREENQPKPSVKMQDLNEPTNKVEPKKPFGKKKSNVVIDTKIGSVPDPSNKVAYLQWLRKNG